MANPFPMTKKMMKIVRQKKHPAKKYTIRCQEENCGEKIGAFKCGSCQTVRCKRHDDERKKLFIMTRFSLDYWFRCSEIDHRDNVPFSCTDQIALYDHMSVYFIKRCSGDACGAKKYCADCLIELQCGYCADCVDISDANILMTKRYCKPCRNNGKLVIGRPRDPTHINPYSELATRCTSDLSFLCVFHSHGGYNRTSF